MIAMIIYLENSAADYAKKKRLGRTYPVDAPRHAKPRWLLDCQPHNAGKLYTKKL